MTNIFQKDKKKKEYNVKGSLGKKKMEWNGLFIGFWEEMSFHQNGGKAISLERSFQYFESN